VNRKNQTTPTSDLSASTHRSGIVSTEKFRVIVNERAQASRSGTAGGILLSHMKLLRVDLELVFSHPTTRMRYPSILVKLTTDNLLKVLR
jgi:hypothetical protein